MSNETRKLDVLAVMDSLVGVAEAMAFRLESNQPAHEWYAKVKATRAAVAKLIEATQQLIGTVEPILADHGYAYVGKIQKAKRVLARIGGSK